MSSIEIGKLYSVQKSTVSFAIWLMDDGTFHKKNYPVYTPYYTLSIKRFSTEEAELAKEIIKSIFSIKATLTYLDKEKDYCKNNKKYKMNNLYFPTNKTSKIQKVIIESDFGDQLQASMSYKIFAA